MVELNVTDRCNRSCSFCPHGQGFQWTGYMSLAVAESVSAQLRDMQFTGLISLCGWGEPLMHRDLLAIIDVLPSDCTLRLVTNGDILYKKPRTLEGLLERNVHEIFVSIYDGPEQYAMFDAAWGQYPNIKLRRLEDRAENFSNRAGTVDIGADRDGYCYVPFYQMFVDWDGAVLLCCHDWNRTRNYGKDLAIAWQKLDRIYDGMRKFAPCNACNVHGTLYGAHAYTEWVNGK